MAIYTLFMIFLVTYQWLTAVAVGASTMWQQNNLNELVSLCHWISAKGWAPATGGNMSIRQDSEICWLSESGKDKGSLCSDDFLPVDITTSQPYQARTLRPKLPCIPLFIDYFPKSRLCYTYIASTQLSFQKLSQVTS